MFVEDVVMAGGGNAAPGTAVYSTLIGNNPAFGLLPLGDGRKPVTRRAVGRAMLCRGVWKLKSVVIVGPSGEPK